MPILCACPNGHSLRVKDKLAGKQGKCPTCGADFAVPGLPTPPTEGGPPPLSIQPATAVMPPLPGAADPPIEWRMARATGEQFGPTVPMVFAQWIEAGRVTPDTLVWRTGWPDWRRADAPNADLPAPLPVAAITPPPIPGVTLPPPPLTISPAAGQQIPTALEAIESSRGKVPHSAAPTSAYNARRRQQAKRRRQITIALALVCVALAALLAVMMSNGAPSGDSAGDSKPTATNPPAAAPQEPAPEATP